METKEKRPAKEVLRGVVDQVYQNAWDAKGRGELVGWSSSKFPQEIAETFGLAICYPENQAAAISAKKGGIRMCEHAESQGYANDICGYARISLAYADLGEAEEKDMPLPDFVLCCNNICNLMTKWYENIARKLNIPLIMIDIPYNNDTTIGGDRVAYIKGQFDNAIKQLEELTGKKWNEEKFQEVMATSNRTAKAWIKACSFCQETPSPLSGFDLFNHMAVIVTARSKPEAADAFEQLAEEYEEAVKNGTSTWRYEENHRIMFEGIPCWPELRALFNPLKEKGINTTAVVYAPAFGFLYENTEELMKAYCVCPTAVSLETAVGWREKLCRENNVNGILVHYNRSCKPWSGFMPEMERRLRDNLGIAVAGFDGDQADPRNFSEAQYRTRVQGLYEIMEANKAKAEVKDNGKA